MVKELIANLSKISSDIDGKIKPENIREGIEIFGVMGSLAPMDTQRKVINPSTEEQIIVPDNDYNGLHEVVVPAVTSGIDENIIPQNIKSGVSILGVEGILSNLTATDYARALELEVEILGQANHVVQGKLSLNGDDKLVTDEKLTTDGTVNDTKLNID